MTIKTFWIIFVKIFGLYLIWQILIILPTLFASFKLFRTEEKADLFSGLSAVTFIILVFVAIVRYCIFQTDRVIEKLHLEKGFEEGNLEINIHRSSLLSISVIVMGGLMIADSLPLLIYNIFRYFQHNFASLGFSDNQASPYVLAYFLKFSFGFFMVSSSRLIVNLIERKRKNDVLHTEEDNS